ncbi:MAG TPA: cupin domain-containing protein [Candidatus Dormibacteraeota bacterium]|nr:cupin domain-containing protein [Candidatus Dormibacteraeota bacterium]
MDTFFQSIPATEGVRKVGRGEGEKFDIAGAHLTWKAKGVDTGCAFSICEQTLAPGEGVPLHSHASAEAFYVLAGAADFFRLLNGKEDWVRCETGGLMILPPNSLHAFYNKRLNLVVSSVFLRSYIKLSSTQLPAPKKTTRSRFLHYQR